MEPVYFIPPSERRRMMLAAQADSATVLISGASGTGKGAIASWIHRHSLRSLKPLIEVHSGSALEESLRNAQGGTIVVTELATLTLQEQQQLLQFLKTHTVPHPKNRTLPLLIQVRVIALTDASLPSRVAAGLFLEELLERFSVFIIQVPSLKERLDEFEPIATTLLTEITKELRKPYLRRVHPDALARLKEQQWPGNIRELRNVLKLAVSRSQTDDLLLADLPALESGSIDFQASRKEFEKIYYRELMASFQGSLEEAAAASQNTVDELRTKLASLGLLETR
jgi:two-component system NtrC family response regulator